MRTTDNSTQVPALDLSGDLESIAVRPGESRYASLRHTYTRLGSPSAVLLVRDATDIAAALAQARAVRAPLNVRSGGHGISGLSTNDGGIVVDLSRLSDVEVLDARSGLVRVGAGARWGEVAAALACTGCRSRPATRGQWGSAGWPPPAASV